MASTERTQQLAILLNLLGDEAVETAKDALQPDTSEQLTRYIKEFKTDPPSKTEIDFVLEDFDRFFSFAMETIQTELDELAAEEEAKEAEIANRIDEEAEAQFDASLDSIKFFIRPELTGDPKLDLNLLHPYQVSYAIKQDNPMAISIVLKCLSEVHAGKTLEYLPESVRLPVFLQLANPVSVSEKVEMQILKATLASALKVEQRIPEEDQKAQMVAVTRSLPKDIRSDLLEKLKEEFPDLADAVKSEMYQFDDILKLADKDIQKILAQSDSDALVLTLVSAEDEIKEKLLGNMSKRARQTIEDELEFKSGAKPEEIESGKRQITEILAKLDEAGEITLE